MELRRKVKELEDMFIEKFVNGEYELTKVDKHTATIKVDNTYVFTFWIASGLLYITNDFCGSSFMEVNLGTHIIPIWEKLSPIISDYREKNEYITLVIPKSEYGGQFKQYEK